MANTLFAEKNKVAWIGVRPGVYGEAINAYQRANNSTVVLYTVPAGKTLLLFHTALEVYLSAAPAADGDLIWQNAVPAMAYMLHSLSNGTTGTGINVASDRAIPLEIPAGHRVVVVSPTAGSYCRGHIEGLLVNPAENV